MDLPTRPLAPSLPPRLSHPLLSSLAHPHFDKRDTEFIRRLRSNCLQAIFTLFAFITSLMRLIMGLLCGAARCFSSRLPVFDRICSPPPQLLFFSSRFSFNILLLIINTNYCIFILYYLFIGLTDLTLFRCTCFDFVKSIEETDKHQNKIMIYFYY